MRYCFGNLGFNLNSESVVWLLSPDHLHLCELILSEALPVLTGAQVILSILQPAAKNYQKEVEKAGMLHILSILQPAG